MKTFKQYLTEKWGRGIPVKYPSGQVISYGRSGIVHHHDKVDGHDVHVMFAKLPSYEAKNGHRIDFMVKHSYHDKGDLGSSGPKILQHVHKVVSGFIAKKKPDLVYMSGNSHEKQQLYDKYAMHLAKHMGGTVETHPTKNEVKIKFKHGD